MTLYTLRVTLWDMRGFLGVLFLFALVCAYWKFVVCVLLAVAVVKAAPVAWRELQSERLEQKARRAELVARADQQHAQCMAGNTAGIYGAYPPAC